MIGQVDSGSARITAQSRRIGFYCESPNRRAEIAGSRCVRKQIYWNLSAISDCILCYCCYAHVSFCEAGNGPKRPLNLNNHSKRIGREMSEAKVCPKCQQSMNRGFIPNQAPDFVYGSLWVEGEPKAGFRGIKVPPELSLPIATYRCVACGFLESYAGVN